MDIRSSGGEQSRSRCHVYIPQEIVEKILPNLPVKSLLRFRCVSKSWRSFFDTKAFINSHLENSKRRAIIKEYCSIIDDPWWDLHRPIKDDPLTTGNVIGCCNGVICILKQGQFFLWNPATRISIKLPTFDFVAQSCFYGWEEIRCGFGWDEESDAYKVFLCTTDSYEGVCKVYSSKTNSWNKKECGRLGYCGACDLYNVGVLACGKIHWVPEKQVWITEFQEYVDCIEYFDLKNEVFGRIELPSEPERGVGRWWLRERDGCLYVLYNHNDDDKGKRRYSRRMRRGRQLGEEGEGREVVLLDVWVMEEYGVKESWVKKSTIPIPKSTLDYQRYVYIESLISPVCEEEEEN